jgi:hypothetical protein
LIQETELHILFSGLNLTDVSALSVITKIPRDEIILVPETPPSQIGFVGQRRIPGLELNNLPSMDVSGVLSCFNLTYNIPDKLKHADDISDVWSTPHQMRQYHCDSPEWAGIISSPFSSSLDEIEEDSEDFPEINESLECAMNEKWDQMDN